MELFFRLVFRFQINEILRLFCWRHWTRDDERNPSLIRFLVLVASVTRFSHGQQPLQVRLPRAESLAAVPILNSFLGKSGRHPELTTQSMPWHFMSFLLQDEHMHYSPYGWKGIVFAVIMVYFLVQVVGWLAGRKLKRLPGNKSRPKRKKGVRH